MSFEWFMEQEVEELTVAVFIASCSNSAFAAMSISLLGYVRLEINSSFDSVFSSSKLSAEELFSSFCYTFGEQYNLGHLIANCDSFWSSCVEFIF